MTIKWIHQETGVLLLFVHSLFLLRSRYLLKRDIAPRRADRWLMNSSRVLFPLALLSLAPVWKELPVLHVLCTLMPLVMMLIFFRRSRRRNHPMRLPLINEFWFAAAVLTGGLP